MRVRPPQVGGRAGVKGAVPRGVSDTWRPRHWGRLGLVRKGAHGAPPGRLSGTEREHRRDKPRPAEAGAGGGGRVCSHDLR